jgi:hypothetical protein
MLQYRFAGLKVGIIHSYSNKFRSLSKYEASFVEKPDIEIDFQSSGYFAEQNYSYLDSDDIAWYARFNEGTVSVYIYLKATNRTEYKIIAEKNWSKVTVLYRAGNTKYIDAFCSYLGNLILSSKILYNQGLVLHASVIAYMGSGIAFTAPSGYGKSTHTRLWEKYFGAEVINDDCPVIRCDSNYPVVYGTPWCGSRHKSVNTSVPLSAIVILEQAKCNSITQPAIKEAIPLLMPRFYLPFYSKELIDIALINAERIIESVPIYLLKCKPDREAAEMVHQCIMLKV